MRPLVPPYYGAPQTEPGVTENTGDKKFKLKHLIQYSAKYTLYYNTILEYYNTII